MGGGPTRVSRSDIRWRLGELRPPTTGSHKRRDLWIWRERAYRDIACRAAYRRARLPISFPLVCRLEPAEILEDLKWAGSNGFVAHNADAFEIVAHDRDALRHLGVWEWSDLELDECCPFCGSLCGMHFQEASQAYYCISCRRLSDFAEQVPDFDCEEDYLAWKADNPEPLPTGMDRFVILGPSPDFPEHLQRNLRLR
jgi:hypothetical protein